MISTFILQIFSTFVATLIGFLPSGQLPTQIGSAFIYFVGVINQFSYVVPVTTLFQALVVVVGFDIAIMFWHFLNWIIRKIPGMQ